MKTWFLLFMVFTLGDGVAEKDMPAPLVKFHDEMFHTEQACKDEFHKMMFRNTPHQVVGWCAEGEALLASPRQILPKR